MRPRPRACSTCSSSPAQKASPPCMGEGKGKPWRRMGSWSAGGTPSWWRSGGEEGGQERERERRK
eukprot:3126162-Rhodomonas_salina.1